MDSEFVEKLQQKREKQNQRAEMLERHSQLLAGSDSVQSAILNAARVIVEAQVGNQPQVTVKNFPSDLATASDIQALRDVLEQNTNKTQETQESGTESLKTALDSILSSLERLNDKDNQSDVTAALSSVEDELKDKDVTVTNLDDLGNFFFELQQAIEGLDLRVNVEKPDLKPVEKKMDEVKEAIQSIVIPEQKELVVPDGVFVAILDELREHRMILQKILTRPIPVGSGGGISTGGSSSTPTADISGGLDNLLLESGDNLLLESDAEDVLLLQ